MSCGGIVRRLMWSGSRSPFFKLHEGRSGATCLIAGKTYLNFASYDYIGLNGEPDVSEAGGHRRNDAPNGGCVSGHVQGFREPRDERLRNARRWVCCAFGIFGVVGPFIGS